MQNMSAMFSDADLRGEIYNLGWGKEIKVIEVFEAVRDALGLAWSHYLTRSVREKSTGSV